MRQLIRQTINQLRRQPVISAVTITGTALSIMLIMIVVMMHQVKVAPFAPESNRDRMLHYAFCSVVHEDWGNSESNHPCTEDMLKQLFKGMKIPEAVTIYTIQPEAMAVGVAGQPTIKANVRETDGDFFRVFDLRFIKGQASIADFDNGRPVVVISENIARRVFNTTEGVVGRELNINYMPYKVVGIVRNVSTLAETAYGDAWAPYKANENTMASNYNNGTGGPFSATILAKSRDDFDAIRQDYEKRLAAFNKGWSKINCKVISRGRPYDQEKNSIRVGANNEPDVEKARLNRLITFIILLLVPAINLTSMTQSRLRQRVSEIGVRRAFGCTRWQIMRQVINENLIVTIIGGAIGVMLGVMAAYLLANVLFAQDWGFVGVAPSVSISMIIQPSTICLALLFCFLLNLLSSGLPALWASRVNIVNAINKRK